MNIRCCGAVSTASRSTYISIAPILPCYNVVALYDPLIEMKISSITNPRVQFKTAAPKSSFTQMWPFFFRPSVASCSLFFSWPACSLLVVSPPVGLQLRPLTLNVPVPARTCGINHGRRRSYSKLAIDHDPFSSEVFS